MRLTILLILFFGALGKLDAQYSELRAEGIELQEEGQYSESINRFLGALVSPDRPRDHDLAEQIKQSQDRWLRQLEMTEQSRRAAEVARMRAQIESRSLALAFQVKSRLAADPDPTHTLRIAEEAYRLQDHRPNLIVLQALMEMAAVHQANNFAYYQDLEALRVDSLRVLSPAGEALADCFTYDPHEFNILEEPLAVRDPAYDYALRFWAPQTGFCGSPYGFDVINEAALLGPEGDTLSRLRQYGGISALAFLPGGRLLTLSDFGDLTYADGAPVGDGEARLWSLQQDRSWEINDSTVRAPDSGRIYRLRSDAETVPEAGRFELLDEEGKVVLTFERDTMDFDGYRLSLKPGDYFAGRVTLRDEGDRRVATLDGAHGLFSDDGRYVLTWRYGAELWLTPYGIFTWMQEAPFHRLTGEERRRYRLN